MTKADVLSVFDEIKVCTHYEYEGNRIDYLPYDINSDDLSPVYITVPGWKKDLTNLHDEENFPVELSSYITLLENELQVPITVVSVGPNRNQTILRKPIHA